MSDKKKLKINDRFIINVNEESFLIKVDEILFIEAREDYSNVHLINGSDLLVRKLLKNWEYQLTGEIFLRIHRSLIINTNYIDRVKKTARSFELFLNNHPEKFIVSQRYSAKFKSKFVRL